MLNKEHVVKEKKDNTWLTQCWTQVFIFTSLRYFANAFPCLIYQEGGVVVAVVVVVVVESEFSDPWLEGACMVHVSKPRGAPYSFPLSLPLSLVHG